MDEKQKGAKFKISLYFCNNQILVFTSALILFPFVWFSFLMGVGFCLVEFFLFLLLIIISPKGRKRHHGCDGILGDQ